VPNRSKYHHRITPQEFKSIRLSLGLAQWELAKILNTSQARVVYWEQGINGISGSLTAAMELLEELARLKGYENGKKFVWKPGQPMQKKRDSGSKH